MIEIVAPIGSSQNLSSGEPGKAKPLSISIVLCTFNGEKYLQAQLDSLVGQTHPAMELVIYDDCSSDGTRGILAKFAESSSVPVKLVYGERNLGVSRAFASAISAAGGDFIALADQDDVWAADRLAHVVAAIRQSPSTQQRPTLFIGDVVLWAEDASPGNKSHPGIRAFARLDAVSWRDFALGNLLPGCSMIFDRRAVGTLLPIPDDAVIHDWWIALCFTCIGDLVYVPEARIYYRLHEHNAQGVPSPSKLWAACVNHGAFQTGINNFAHALLQLRLLRSRLGDSSGASCAGLGSMCELLTVSPLMRPIRLLSLGVLRRSLMLTAISCLVSVFVSEETLHDVDRPFL